MGAWNTVRNYIDRTLKLLNLKIESNMLEEMPHPQLRLEIIINTLQNKNIRKGYWEIELMSEKLSYQHLEVSDCYSC